MFVSVLFGFGMRLMMLYLATALHELAHYAMSRKCGVKDCSFGIGACGLVLETAPLASSGAAVLISVSGPAMSFCLYIYARLINVIFVPGIELWDFFIFVNLCIGIVNLMPIGPLDGGMLLRTLMCRYLGIIRGGRVFASFSFCACVMYAGLCVLVVLRGVFTPVLFVMLIFLISGILRERLVRIYEQKKVLSGEISYGAKCRYLAADTDTRLIRPISYISDRYTVVAAIFDGESFIGAIGQRELIESARKYGTMIRLGEAFGDNAPR